MTVTWFFAIYGCLCTVGKGKLCAFFFVIFAKHFRPGGAARALKFADSTLITCTAVTAPRFADGTTL